MFYQALFSSVRSVSHPHGVNQTPVNISKWQVVPWFYMFLNFLLNVVLVFPVGPKHLNFCLISKS